MIGSILVFLIVLSILVIVHEFGHYWVAKRNGIWVEEFGFGLPPRIFGKKIGETIFSINLFPFGGFVRLHGESDESGITNPKRAFLNKNKRTRVSVVIAGVIMNFLLAIFCFATVYSITGIPTGVKTVEVLNVSPDSPALSGGIVVGDIIKKVDGVDLRDSEEFQSLVQKSKGKKINLEIETGPNDARTTKKLSISAKKDKNDGRYYLGIVMPTQIYFPPIWQRPFYGVYYGMKEAVLWGRNILFGLLNIFQNLFVGQAPKDLTGPVGIYAVTTEAIKAGALTLINFVGILSVNLAILNVLPFPALDGGRLLFIAIEGIIGRKVLPKIESAIHTIGMIILLLLLLAITTHDIQRLIAAGGISGFINSMVK